MPDYTVNIPEITTASLITNPVTQNAAFTVSITIIDNIIIVEPVSRHSGTFNSGEELSLPRGK